MLTWPPHDSTDSQKNAHILPPAAWASAMAAFAAFLPSRCSPLHITVPLAVSYLQYCILGFFLTTVKLTTRSAYWAHPYKINQ